MTAEHFPRSCVTVSAQLQRLSAYDELDMSRDTAYSPRGGMGPAESDSGNPVEDI